MLSFKIQKSKIAILFLLLGCIISSCNDPKSPLAEYGPIFEKVMISDTSVFRGFNFGVILNLVRPKKPTRPVGEIKGNLISGINLISNGRFI